MAVSFFIILQDYDKQEAEDWIITGQTKHHNPLLRCSSRRLFCNFGSFYFATSRELYTLTTFLNVTTITGKQGENIDISEAVVPQKH